MKVVVFIAAWGSAWACTTLVVGKKASKDGSVLLTHSNDEAKYGGDARLCFIPAQTYPVGSKRPVYYSPEVFPRYVGVDRGDCYMPKVGQVPFEPIGYIPQVNRTYAYYEACYGMMNEVGVGIGESTCSGVFGTDAAGHGGQALLSIDVLTQLALERAASAREAVKTMGALAEEFGFYGVDHKLSSSAESLMVSDPNEAFMFHILPDPTGMSAIWVARRVPDDEVGVIANMFVIREVDFGDSENFLISESARTVAEERGWWTRGQPFDFTRIYSDGEYGHKYSSGRRQWGAYHLFGAHFPDDYDDLRYEAVYPATAKPRKLVTVEDLFAIHRNHYEGTQYDMTKGLAAGPWGDPDRWKMEGSSVKGHWERSIGIFRTSQTHVVQARDSGVGTVLWYGPYNADGTVFFPVPQPLTSVPSPYLNMDPKKMDRSSMYWAHKYVFNLAKIKYSYAMQDIRAVQHQLERAGAKLVASLDADYDNGVLTQLDLNSKIDAFAKDVLNEFWKLPDRILFKYADGWLNDDEMISYPDWWLKAVGYEQGPPDVPNHVKGKSRHFGPVLPLIVVVVACVFLSLLGVLCCLRQRGKAKAHRTPDVEASLQHLAVASVA